MTDAMDIRTIGCCGAHCATCRSLLDKTCRGCKLGYDSGGRDINKVRCKIKACCFRDRGFETCADCEDYADCSILNDFYSKSSYKYGKYHQSLDYIRENGYAAFKQAALKWKGPYGNLD